MAPARPRPPAPETIEDRCVTCDEVTVQAVLKGRVVKGGLGVEGTFRCTECDTVASGLVSFPAPRIIPLIISYEAESVPAQVEVPEDAPLEVGDQFMVDDERIELTGIELEDEGRRVTRARADEVRTLWGKNQDRVKVKFGMNEGDITHSFETWFGPEDEVHVGEKFDLGDEEVVVDRIVTTGGSKERGGWNVREIKRVWVRRPKPRAEDRKPASRAGPRSKPDDAGKSGKGRGEGARAGRSGASRGCPGGRPGGRRGGRPSGGGRSSGMGRPRGRGGQGPTGRR